MPPLGEGLLYHYTTASVAVESILHTGQLRLGLFEFTNDPREAKEWFLSAAVAAGVAFEAEELEAMSRTADRLLRRSVKLACFTEDGPPRNDVDGVSGRGFGHSRLWSHYAGNHSGVCIGFDRPALLAALARQLEPLGPTFQRAVDYVEDPSPPYAATHVDVEQVDEFGLDALLAARVQQYWRELFFTKDLDWASEHEFRCVVLSDDPLPAFVDVADCIRLIVLGDSFPTSRLPSVHHAVRAMSSVDVVMLSYMNGRPQLLPAAAPQASSKRPHRRSGTVADRRKALVDAEREAARTHAEGAVLAREALEALFDALERCAERLRRLKDVSVAVHDSSYAAVPLAERQRAAGVTRRDVIYSGGRMCVAEHQPRYSVTFVLSVAAQVLTEKRVRLHVVLETELWQASGNERRELWRGRAEIGFDQAARCAVKLGGELQDHLGEAIDGFELVRQSV